MLKLKRLPIALAAIICIQGNALAWNKAGHMVSASIAYQDLRTDHAAVVVEVVKILEQHPDFKQYWEPQLSGLSEPEKSQRLFMLAARWPDDIRGKSEDRPTWHYVGFPYVLSGASSSVAPKEPATVNLLTAYSNNQRLVADQTIPLAQKAVALCWLFHLTGDSHQPLHAVSMYSDSFPTGDRGGNSQYVRLPGGTRAVNLHSLWDGLILGSEKVSDVTNTATELRSRYKRTDLVNIDIDDPQKWTKEESLALAKRYAYLNGNLKTAAKDSKDMPDAPDDYARNAKSVAEKQIVLSGYRLADKLTRLINPNQISRQ